MIIFPDGTFWLEEGEVGPLICPKCFWPKELKERPEYDDPNVELTCDKCSHKSDWEKWFVQLEKVEGN